jgi:hypothetical protein
MFWPAAFMATGIAIGSLGIGVALAPQANAIPKGPNSCVLVNAPFVSYKDCDLWPDGSYYHEVLGGYGGLGGGESYRACDGFPIPPATDNDPRTPC